MSNNKAQDVPQIMPGVILTLVIAALALGVNSIFAPVSPVIVAVIIGIAAKNTVGIPEKYQIGSKFAAKKLLKLGIILLGIRLSFFEILNLGGWSLVIIVVCITLALTVVIQLSRKFQVPEKLATLIAIGTAICGNSAIVASAPVIKAKEEEVAFAVAVITVFGLSAIVVYPIIGSLLGLTAVEFGTWAGTGINDTGQVVAAGFIYGEQAGEVATVVKLTRNIFIAPVVFIFSYLSVKEGMGESAKDVSEVSTEGCNSSKGDNIGVVSRDDKVKFVEVFPWFVLGFLAMALLRTTGFLPEFAITGITFASQLLIIMALAGIGLEIKIESLRGMGMKAFITGLTASIIMGVTSLILVLLLIQ